jgi:hypothetical protein
LTTLFMPLSMSMSSSSCFLLSVIEFSSCLCWSSHCIQDTLSFVVGEEEESK